MHDRDGGKLSDARRIQGVKKVLGEVLADDDLHQPPTRPRLQRARASIAR